MNGIHLGSLLRLFFVKASRNRKTVDGMGFFFVLAPLLKNLARTREDLVDMAVKHTGYFNTNVFMASYIVGAVENMEWRRSKGENIPSEKIDDFKETLSLLLATRGSFFFRVVLLPLGLTIASLFAIYGSYIGLLVFLVVYNAYHFHYRIGGYITGLTMGEGVSEALLKGVFGKQTWLRNCAAFVAGVFAAVALIEAVDWGGVALGGGGLALTLIGMLSLRRFSFYLYVLITIIASYIFVFLYEVI
jgi:PTS system mannose-specific IID component